MTLALAPELLPAQELLTRVLILQRLIVPETSGPLSDPPPAAEALMARATGHDAAAELHRAIAAAKDQIRNEWRRTFGGGWEDQ